MMEDKFQNWLTISNAYADAKRKNGLMPMSEKAGRKAYADLTRSLISVSNSMAPDHNAQVAELRKALGGHSEAVDRVENMAHGLQGRLSGIARNALKMGVSASEAETVALNSYFGNPGFDQFAGLQQLSDQLYEQLTFVQSFIEEGDAVQLAPDVASGAKAISRFRVPRVQASGSAKVRQGDLNPYGSERLYSNNTANIDLLNVFKNAVTVDQEFFIDNEMQQAIAGYSRSIAPALAGFILQNMLFATQEEQVMQMVERTFVDGWGGNSYDGDSGSYGILTPSIMLALGSATAAAPVLAAGADWAANSTTLIQQITNYNFKPASAGAIILPLAVDTAAATAMNMYLDVVRLLNLIALTNVNTGRKVTLYMPTSIYAILVQYLSTGTFNRTLGEALRLAVDSGTFNSVEIKTSGLLNARTNSFNVQQYNHIVAVVHGAPTGKKAIIHPMATATPRVVTGLVSEMRSSFAASLTFGGPMMIQTGQVFDMVISQHN